MKDELNVKKFWELLRKYLPLKKNIGILLFLIFSQVFCTLYMPIAVMNTIDISGGNYYEWKKICWIAFIILLQVIFSVGVLYLMSCMAHKVIMQLRDDLWSKVLYLPIEYFDRTETGEIMSRITNDTMVISEFITNDFLSAITGVISIIGSIILIFAVDWKMAVIMIGLVPITVFAISPLNKKLYRISRDFQNKTGEYQARMNNVLTNIRLVKTCIAEEKEEERGKILTKELFNIGIKGGKITALVQPLTTMLIFLLLILIFGYGSVRVANGSLSAGSLVAIIYYLFQIATPCMGLTAFVGQLNRSCGAMERISKILNEEIVEKKIKKEIIIADQKCNCGLVLDNISFRYSDRKNTLCSISFFIEKGETLAIVGESGSGKSTILNIIANKLMLTGKEYATSNSFGIVDYCGKFSSECQFSYGEDEFGNLFRRFPENSRFIKSEDILYEIKKIQQRQILSDGMEYDYMKNGHSHKEAEEYFQTREGRHQIEYIEFAQEKYSNGETAMKFFEEYLLPDALYLLDEPEVSLSPANQVLLAEEINKLARLLSCQFIIATHSPFMLGTLDAKIYNIDKDDYSICEWYELENVRYFYDFFKKHEKKFE